MVYGSNTAAGRNRRGRGRGRNQSFRGGRSGPRQRSGQRYGRGALRGGGGVAKRTSGGMSRGTKRFGRGGSGGFNRRGRGGKGGGRGGFRRQRGRGDKGVKTKEDLDKEMDEYFLGNTEMAAKKLDRDLDDYFSTKAAKKGDGEEGEAAAMDGAEGGEANGEKTGAQG